MIKLFEEFSEKLYSLLTDEEAKLLLAGKLAKLSTPSNKEIGNLIDELNSTNAFASVDGVEWEGRKLDSRAVAISKNSHFKFYLFKDIDDYYYIFPYQSNDAYKCDDIAGIIQLLEEVNI